VGGLVIHKSLYRGAHPDQKKYLFPQADTQWCEQAARAEREARLSNRPPDRVDSEWLETACANLLPQLISINCLFDPEGVLIGGRVPQPWLEAVAARCNTLIHEQAPHIPSHTPVQPARLAADATLIGAASLPMRARLFPTNEALLKTDHHAY
jgi:predicted NBD/HSP70 family sugar kinase